jgi:hypothetical protein
MLFYLIRRFWSVGLGLTALALAACNAPPTPAPAATPIVIPTVGVTVLPLATATPAPSATATTPPLPSATASATTTATPAAINPLTGLAVAEASVLNRRPLAIKVAHFPRSVREHQVGLSLADNVWEHYAEGGVIRFTGIFLSQSPEKVGNERSERLIDAHLGEASRAMLVASGSSTGTMNRLREHEELFKRVIAEATGYGGCPVLCREESASVTTHKLFTSPAALWQLADELKLNGPQDLSGFEFDASGQPPANGTPISTVHIDFQLNNTVSEYRYDPATGLYGRWVDTNALPELAPHIDTLTGGQLTTANIVVIYVTHVTSNIREAEGGTRYFSYDVLLSGEGQAKLFRDGQMYELTWERADEYAGLPRFHDAAGNSLPFKPGVIFLYLVSPN